MKKKHKELELVELGFEESDPNGSGVMAISIVERPAIKEGFTLMSEELEVKFERVEGEKRLLVGPVLIPNLPIYRKEGEREFNAFFKADSIEKMAFQYLKKGRQSNATVEHQIDVDGLCVVESWIITDNKSDKSTALGMSYPNGTWMVSMKVDRDDIWDDFVETGKLTGFSIEGLLKGRTVHQSEELSKEDEKRVDSLFDLFEKLLTAK